MSSQEQENFIKVTNLQYNYFCSISIARSNNIKIDILISDNVYQIFCWVDNGSPVEKFRTYFDVVSKFVGVV